MLANPEAGEVSIPVNGRTFVLKLSMNAACAIEDKTGKDVGVLLAEAGRLNFRAMRYLTWVLLQKHHHKDFPTEEAVGEWIDAAGGPMVFYQLLAALGRQAIDTTAAKPNGADVDAGNPPAAHAH